MKSIKLLLRPVALGLLWLSVGLGCKKDIDPLCETKGCCSQFAAARVAAQLRGSPVGKLKAQYPFITLREIVYDKEPYKGQPKQIGFLTLCDGTQDMVDVFITDQAQMPGYNPDQEYRIWGSIYEATWIIPFIPDRLYALKIDRIEKMP